MGWDMVFVLLGKITVHFFLGGLESDSHICRSRRDGGWFNRQADSHCYPIVPPPCSSFLVQFSYGPREKAVVCRKMEGEMCVVFG